MTTANDFLMGSGVKSAKFPEIGASVTGTIAREPEVQQQRDFKTGELKFWDDGKPMQQLQVVLATSERDPEVDDDKGERAVYVKARMQKAVREAVRASGAKGLAVGGKLTVTFVAEEPATGGYPPKIYTASYEAPTANAAADFLGINGAQQAAPAPAPAPAAVPVAAPAGVPAEALAALQQLTPEQRQAIGLS